MNGREPTGLSRRALLQSLGAGFGYLAFAGLAHEAAARDRSRGAASPELPATHHPPHARRVIFLSMNGGPSHVDLFDYKPMLQQRHGKPLSGKVAGGGAKLLGSPFTFTQHGECGHWISEVFPQLARHADDLCLVHSMHTDLPNHSQAYLQMHTGSFQFVRPSVGAWTLYGLGSENDRLPGFITINPPSDNGGARNYGSAFLPAACQGTRLGGNQIPGFYAALFGKDQEPGPPLKYLDQSRLSPELQRKQLDLVRALNERKLERGGSRTEIEGAISALELAFRMQEEVPQVLDLRDESAATLELYGCGAGRPSDRFGRQCLLARRLAEAGVRFIELTAPVGWDHHFQLADNLRTSCEATDQPLAGLLSDLKQRGLLDETLVIWGGEFGRTPPPANQMVNPL